jgi:hypothetical protein
MLLLSALKAPAECCKKIKHFNFLIRIGTVIYLKCQYPYEIPDTEHVTVTLNWLLCEGGSE